MQNKLTRRDFLKIATGVAGVTTTGFSAAVRRKIIEPFVRPPEVSLPGDATWYASTCRQCPAGCGIIVRIINGRAKKIEGNPLHPVNQGRLCARGQAGLQVLYNPDRLKNAVRQVGGRGSREFEPIYWTEAVDSLYQHINAVGSPDRLAYLGGMIPDHRFRIASLFMEKLGAPPPVVFDTYTALEGRNTAERMSELLFGAPDLPVYDIANTEVVLSFGANFLETWMSPVAQSVAYGNLRQGQFGGRGFFAQIEPRLSATAASADEWIPVRPGTEGHVALAIGRIIVEENLGHTGSHRQHAVLYQDIDVREMSAISDVPIDRLSQLARVFADADQAVAIPGGYLSGQTNGLQSMLAVQMLNYIVAQFGRVGGTFISQSGPTADLRMKTHPDSFDTILRLIEKMRSGQVDVLLIDGANPLYDLPRSSGFAEAIKQVPVVVSFSPFVDETAVQSDLVLPADTYLESWGYQVPAPGADRPVVSGQQPVVQQLYDTRSTVDVLLETASRIGGELAAALPWADEADFVQSTVSQILGSSLSVYETDTGAGFWALWRQFGGWWSEKPIQLEPEVTSIVQKPLEIPLPEFNSNNQEYPFHFYPYLSSTLSDGRGANQPWLQEAPDPMTTVSWNTWVEINPETAEKLGVDDNSIVRVISAYGEIEAAVVVYRGIRPDVVAMPVGQGHTDLGRFAISRGARVMDLVAPIRDEHSGSLAWGSTLVRVEATDKHFTLARLESLDGEGRESLR